MDPESKRALRQIAEIRGCSWEEAKYFCSRIRGYQGDRKSPYVDISGMLQVLESRAGSYSDRKLAREAEEITSAKRLESEEEERDTSSRIVIDDPKIEKFAGTGEHQAFIDWIDRNAAEGFVLNLKGRDSDPVIHSARCSHLRPDPQQDRVATARAKLCSTDREVLRRKALNLAECKIVLCEHCGV
jgi:hypothetical protein